MTPWPIRSGCVSGQVQTAPRAPEGVLVPSRAPERLLARAAGGAAQATPVQESQLIRQKARERLQALSWPDAQENRTITGSSAPLSYRKPAKGSQRRVGVTGMPSHEVCRPLVPVVYPIELSDFPRASFMFS
jgi:hypothetical protein